MRIGVISSGSPDYLIDIVTDGLIRSIGRENLSLDYNVRGGWGGQYSILLHGFQGPEPFDIRDADALIGSVRSFTAITAWMKETGKKKVAIIDGEDDSRIRDPWEEKASVYFKREYLKDRKYPGNILPLPFAAIPEALPDITEVVHSVFFLAHGSNPFRAEISAALESMGHTVRKDRIEKPEYNLALATSLVGVSVRGGGWDTYRYWEVPYLGTALLSQRLETLIPSDFQEDVEAVFFSGIQEFKTKLTGMLADPERTLEIGRLSRKKCMSRHLSIHRAETVLKAIS